MKFKLWAWEWKAVRSQSKARQTQSVWLAGVRVTECGRCGGSTRLLTIPIWSPAPTPAATWRTLPSEPPTSPSFRAR
jgi:hypothetical protein